MLQLSGTLRNASSRLTPISSWRLPTQQLVAACSGNANPSPVLRRVKKKKSYMEPTTEEIQTPKTNNPMIQAAFDSLKITKFGSEISEDSDMTEMESKSSANVMGLLKIVEDKQMTPENASAIVTLLIDWVNSGKAKLSDFEHDKRFLHLCNLLSQLKKQDDELISKESEANILQTNELNSFFGISEINEATKEVANISTNQMIKVLTALAQQRRRTTPLLRSLSFNIGRTRHTLGVKQISDILYSLAVLNYPDEVLMQKVTSDLILCVEDVTKNAIIGSIFTSLGVLRYKNEELLDELSEWAVNNSEKLRPQDLCSFFMTLAMLGYTPANINLLKEVLIKPLKESDMTRPAEWLDIVWALVVLQLVENHHIASVLDRKFIEKLAESHGTPAPKKLKLLNINAAAQLLAKDYEGPLLASDSEMFSATFQRSKEKESFSKSVTTAVKNIFPPPQYGKFDVDSGYGFLLDAEFCINNEGTRLPLDCNLEETNGSRIAVIALSYNDFCRGKQNRLGFHDLYSRLLEAKGYKILSIAHTEFIAKDKIIDRITYINDQIKSIAK